jgi:hypothetical protein
MSNILSIPKIFGRLQTATKALHKNLATFLNQQTEPLLSKLEINWNEETAPNYINSFYKSNLNSQLYQQLDRGFLLYMPKQTHTKDNQLCS